MRGVDEIYFAGRAFATVLKDGTVVTWGQSVDGGDSNDVQAKMRGVDKTYSKHTAFSEILRDGPLVT